MKNIISAIACMMFLLSPAIANEGDVSAPLKLGIQEVHAATLDQNENEKPKKKKASKKGHKAKKAKKTSSRN
ncbi:MAG: hypothetical protein A3B68_02110 [Candidatus Melainabacteria bacterium RIFCSPHIGHO2_02_FULL_34_12]|nr:MAG: hypothetical protein A3B68_02110 [Candidatus Melainabacteria bacterium RIFCSPHIGHO2_02_FULL_34_12]